MSKGCKQNLLEACRYSFISCDLNLSEGCLNAGVCLSECVGGLPRNMVDAVKYLDKSCDAQNAIACTKLFKLFIDGKNGVVREPSKAFDYAKRACDMNDLYGCLNASIMCRKGDGIPKDMKLAEEYRKRVENLKKEMESSKEHEGVVFGEQHK